MVKAVGRYRAYDAAFTCNGSRGSLQMSFVPVKGWVAVAGLDVENPAGATAAQTPGTVTLSASPAAPTGTTAITQQRRLPAVATTTVTPTLTVTTTKTVATVTPATTYHRNGAHHSHDHSNNTGHKRRQRHPHLP